jgi:RNA polymerase sigma-70 factor (sigma-E family)
MRADVAAGVAMERPRTAQLSKLYAQHGPRLGRLAYLLTGDPELAKDLTQEAFARLIARIGSLRNPDAVEAYLRRCVVNLARRHWRQVGRERVFVRREGPMIVRETAALPDVPGREALWAALERLPYRQRAALVLRFYADLSERQIAGSIGCAVGTVKSLVSRGLEALREQMGGTDHDR